MTRRRRAPEQPPPAYVILSLDDLQAAFDRDDIQTIIWYYRQNPAPSPVSTALLIDWLETKRRGRGRPRVDDVRRDTEDAFIEIEVAKHRSRKEGHFQAASKLKRSISTVTHALSRRGK
jgi:hypothetical protein